MTNDLLPDEIYVEAVITDDVTGEGEIIGWTHPSDEGDPDTKYIRADLVITPNKPAEVDLYELKREVRSDFFGTAFEPPDDFDAHLALHGDKVIDHLASSGHLATGKSDTDVIAAYSAAFPMSANEEHAKWFAEYVAGIIVTGKGGELERLRRENAFLREITQLQDVPVKTDEAMGVE